MERIDCHTHTVYSGHGEGSVADVVAAAKALSMATIALTEHLTVPEGQNPTYSYSMSPAEAVQYRSDVMAAREENPGIDVVYGCEADWLENGRDAEFISKVAQGYDYVLGSVHFVDGWAFDDPAIVEQWQEHSVDATWRRYIEIWCGAAQSKAPFTCMSHPDLPKKFGFYPSFDLSDSYRMMAEAAKAGGRIVEVNTSGLRKPVGKPYPCDELLKAFCEAGVACTIGSDAHCPQDVGAGFDVAIAAMMRAGYKQLAAPVAGGGLRYIALEA